MFHPAQFLPNRFSKTSFLRIELARSLDPTLIAVVACLRLNDSRRKREDTDMRHVMILSIVLFGLQAGACEEFDEKAQEARDAKADKADAAKGGLGGPDLISEEPEEPLEASWCCDSCSGTAFPISCTGCTSQPSQSWCSSG